MHEITWICEICIKERPDEAISVHKVDLSEAFGIPTSTCQRNIKYCNDNKQCLEGAKAEGENEITRARNIKSREDQEQKDREQKMKYPKLNAHTFVLNPEDNGGEQIHFNTTISRDDEDNVELSHEITLISYANSASINCRGITPEQLRAWADSLEKKINEKISPEKHELK